MARLYADENFPLPSVEALRTLGHDVLTTADAGKANRAIPDREVLAFASAEDRAVMTLNRLHFVKLHRSDPNHAGIIVCTVDPDFQALAGRIHRAVLELTSLQGQLVKVNRSQ